MIKVLGVQRILMLVFLLAINCAFAAGVYLYLTPELSKKQRELSALSGQTKTLQQDISRIEVEFSQLEKQQEEFEILKERGFFNRQSRREAEIILNEIQKKTGVASAVVSIKPGVTEENPEAKKSAHAILRSPIEIEIEALHDVDIYKYIYLLEKFFPGHITLKRAEFNRESDINGTILRAIASGSNLPLVRARISILWRTMIPEEEVIDRSGGP